MLHGTTGGIRRVPDGLQIGESNENTTVFIDFQRIQVEPGGRPGILTTWSKEGKASVAGGRQFTGNNIAN